MSTYIYSLIETMYVCFCQTKTRTFVKCQCIIQDDKTTYHYYCAFEGNCVYKRGKIPSFDILQHHVSIDGPKAL